jgi:hypothetical protein
LPLFARVIARPAHSFPGPVSGRLRRVPAAPSGNPTIGDAVRLGDEVHAVVHPVDQIDVQEAGRTEHDRGARRGAAARVRGGVADAQVRFDLDDARDARRICAAATDEELAEQLARDGRRRPRVEAARERRQIGDP